MKGRQRRTIGKTSPPSDDQPHELRTHRFFEDVFEVVRLVPPGRVTSYGAIANYLGSGLSARMVGWAMNASHRIMPPVPAHRVVNRNGMLSGRMHFETPETMEKHLQSEGVSVQDNTIVNFAQVFWDPIKELGI